MDKIRIQVTCLKCDMCVSFHIHIQDREIVHSRLANVDGSTHDCSSVSAAFQQLRDMS